MNPAAVFEEATKQALQSLIHAGDAPELVGTPIMCALDAESDTLPQINIRAVAREVITYNLTYEIGLALGVVTSANPEETSPDIARRMANAIARVVSTGDFPSALAAAGETASQPFVLVNRPRLTDAIAVETEGGYAYQQAATVSVIIQF